MPYTEATEQTIVDDFRRLWDTGFLDDMWIELVDEPWENGVVGKKVIYNLEERQRVRMVTFEGSDEIDRADVDEAMRENGIALRVDSFVDQSAIGRVKNLVQFMFAEKGYQFAEVNHEITELAGGPKTVQVTFHTDEGPKVFVDDISFARQRGHERPKAARQDERHEAALLALVDHRTRHPTRRPSTSRMRIGSSRSIGMRVTSMLRLVSPTSITWTHRTTVRTAASVFAFRSRKASDIGSAKSPSKATTSFRILRSPESSRRSNPANTTARRTFAAGSRRRASCTGRSDTTR